MFFFDLKKDLELASKNQHINSAIKKTKRFHSYCKYHNILCLPIHSQSQSQHDDDDDSISHNNNKKAITNTEQETNDAASATDAVPVVVGSISYSCCRGRVRRSSECYATHTAARNIATDHDHDHEEGDTTERRISDYYYSVGE